MTTRAPAVLKWSKIESMVWKKSLGIGLKIDLKNGLKVYHAKVVIKTKCLTFFRLKATFPFHIIIQSEMPRKSTHRCAILTCNKNANFSPF